MLTADEARSVLAYDPDDGTFRWKTNHRKRKAGNLAGYKRPDGYVVIFLGLTPYYAHRLAWLCHFGRWPKRLVDHVNHDPSDNRIVNLREATDSQNKFNRGKQANSKSGVKGVVWIAERKKWRAHVNKSGRYHFFGYHDTKEAAAEAYARGVKGLVGEFASTE